MDQDGIDTTGRARTAGLSRRGVLRALGAGGLLAAGVETAAGGRRAERLRDRAGKHPHQHLHDRTRQRKRKQRNDDNRNDKDRNTDGNGNGSGGGLGGIWTLGASVAFANQSSATFSIRVIGENGDVNYDCAPGWNATLSVTESDGDGIAAVTFVIASPGWADDLYVQAWNHLVGKPSLDYDTARNCLDSAGQSRSPGFPIYCGSTMTQTGLDVGGSVTIAWLDGQSFKVERQSDSSDYKMFLVTALA